jgi:hypothetical protein
LLNRYQVRVVSRVVGEAEFHEIVFSWGH